MGTHHTTIDLLGIEAEVEVDFNIISYGSSPSGYGFDGSYDPGEGAEIEIISVKSVLTGDDYTKIVEKAGVGSLAYGSIFEHIKGKFARRDGFYFTSYMIDVIENEILEDPDYFIYDDPYEGYEE